MESEGPERCPPISDPWPTTRGSSLRKLEDKELENEVEPTPLWPLKSELKRSHSQPAVRN